MLGFKQFLLEMQSNEHLADLLKPEYGGRTGPEKAKRLSPTVTVHSSKFGSHRFVKHDGDPVAAIQVMSREKGKGHVANAYTHPEHRRKGHASELVAHARKMFPKMTFSDDRSGDGAAFMKSHQ